MDQSCLVKRKRIVITSDLNKRKFIKYRRGAYKKPPRGTARGQMRSIGGVGGWSGVEQSCLLPKI